MSRLYPRKSLEIPHFFYGRGNHLATTPEKLPTRDVLSYLRNLEGRPWNRWGSDSRNHLSNLLRPFGIFSCDIYVDGASLKGYRLQDFEDAWERYGGPLATHRDRENSVAAS